MKHRVTEDMNDTLQQPFSKEAIIEALSQIGPLKSPRPNGFSAYFLQSQWRIVGGEVCSTILNFFNDGVFDDHINFMHIVLISKVKNLVKASDFRPISLCNVVYKLLSKVLASVKASDFCLHPISSFSTSVE